jgi:hypothetical protein
MQNLSPKCNGLLVNRANGVAANTNFFEKI